MLRQINVGLGGTCIIALHASWRAVHERELKSFAPYSVYLIFT